MHTLFHLYHLFNYLTKNGHYGADGSLITNKSIIKTEKFDIHILKKMLFYLFNYLTKREKKTIVMSMGC